MVRVSGRIARFRDVGGVGSRARRSGNLVADVDEQLRATGLAVTQGVRLLKKTPDAYGGREDDGERDRRRWKGEGMEKG